MTARPLCRSRNAPEHGRSVRAAAQYHAVALEAERLTIGDRGIAGAELPDARSLDAPPRPAGDGVPGRPDHRAVADVCERVTPGTILPRSHPASDELFRVFKRPACRGLSARLEQKTRRCDDGEPTSHSGLLKGCITAKRVTA